MKKLWLPLSVLLFVCILYSACDPFYLEGDFFFFRNAGSDMPVWVNGNTDSGTLLLTLHGGPGGSGMTMRYIPSLQTLETYYGVVYWDQRASGISQGNAKTESFTVDQFVADLDILVDILQERYAPKQIVMLGASWGGALGTAYLLDPLRHDKITGWIDMDGGHNLKLGFELSVRWMKEAAQERIDRNEDVDLWHQVLQHYEENPVVTAPYVAVHSYYVNLAGGYTHDPDSIISIEGTEVIKKSFFSATWFTNQPYLRSNFDMWDLNLSDEMHAITLPTLILWGRYDGILPVELAHDAYESLGTPEADKSLVIFEQSAHSPCTEEPSLFVDTVVSFISGLTS
jgi:proline iminopeptidase